MRFLGYVVLWSHHFRELRSLLMFLQPGVHVRGPAQVLVIVVYHTCSRYCRWRGHCKVLNLEEERHLIGHRDTVVVY